jgi:hypothetical protein
MHAMSLGEVVAAGRLANLAHGGHDDDRRCARHLTRACRQLISIARR